MTMETFWLMINTKLWQTMENGDKVAALWTCTPQHVGYMPEPQDIPWGRQTPSANHPNLPCNTENTGPWQEDKSIILSIPMGRNGRTNFKCPQQNFRLYASPCFRLHHSELHSEGSLTLCWKSRKHKYK